MVRLQFLRTRRDFRPIFGFCISLKALDSGRLGLFRVAILGFREKSGMKGPVDRTKVVLRHLPPSISQPALTEQIDGVFGGRYDWLSFRPGKVSPKFQSYSRAYIAFKKPDDVIEFAEFFHGHVFVNEKGLQFKTVVEYAPLQRVPKQWTKKDGREGTIVKDPEYLEFLEFVSKPVENLPSAEIQLERREAERAGSAKEAPIVTPLMDFIRQKRASKIGSRRSSSNGKPNRRAAGGSIVSSGSTSSKRGSEKKRNSSTMYVLRDTTKSSGTKDKSTHILASKRDDQQASDKALVTSGTEVLEGDVVSGSSDTPKKKVLLLKGKERDISHLTIPDQHSVTVPVKNHHGSPAPRQIQRREGSSRIIRTILLNKDSCHSQSSSGAQSEQQIQTLNSEKERRPPRPRNLQILKNTNGAADNIVGNDKQERCARNKDRPDRGVWAPLRRSDGSHESVESLSSSATMRTQFSLDSLDGSNTDIKVDMPSARSGDVKAFDVGRTGHHSTDNGYHRHTGRRVTTHNLKDGDCSLIMGETKSSKRGGASAYGPHEKQVWVQKSSAAS